MGCSCTREMVSKNKRRIHARLTNGDEVNLDLVEIHPRIVCMGFPATGVEALYRNPYEDVLKYLNATYGKRYKVYNLCNEAKYQYDPATHFDGRVSVYPFADGTPCALEVIPRFVHDAKAWLDFAPDRVVVIHCKAGKGRTGLMACCLLMALEHGTFTSTTAIEHYGQARTTDGFGLTHRSQRRYVDYYYQLLQHSGGRLPPRIPTVAITEIALFGMYGKVSFDVLRVTAAGGAINRVALLGSGSHGEAQAANGVTVRYDSKNKVLRCVWQPPLTVSADVRMQLETGNGDWIGALSVHTLFLQKSYPFAELDKIYKAKNLVQSARVELTYTTVVE